MRRKTRFKRGGGYDSQQEQDLAANYPQLKLKPSSLTYDREYRPDFYLGRTSTGSRVYVECKEWLPLAECTKLRAVADSNPDVILLVLAKSIQRGAETRLTNHPRILVHEGYARLPFAWLDLITPRQ